MENEIKFRAWNHRTNDWETNSFDADLDDENYLQIPSYYVINTMYHKNNGYLYTFQLSSLLIDTNGSEIYNGDIIKINQGQIISQEYDFPNDDAKETFKDIISDVKLIQGAFSYFHPNVGEYVPLLDTECEVIGNIFENPELLN